MAKPSCVAVLLGGVNVPDFAIFIIPISKFHKGLVIFATKRRTFPVLLLRRS